jgi:hypothetical protein
MAYEYGTYTYTDIFLRGDLKMFDEQKWQEAYIKAKDELQGVPEVVLVAGRKGFCGDKPRVFIDIPVRGNKALIKDMVCRGWRKLHSNNVRGNRILEMCKDY